MSENGDFEIVPNTRNVPAPQPPAGGSPGMDKLAGAVADNFDRILDVAGAIAEIERMKVQKDVYVEQLREKRRMLETEAKAYAVKVEADADRAVRKAEIIRCIMRDYYHSGQNRLSGEELSKIISDVLDHMGEL